MTKLQEKTRLHAILNFLPKRLSDEIVRITESRCAGLSGLREISLRANGLCELNISGERIELCSAFDSSDMESTIISLTDGALYAHRDSLASGYICLEGGIRVGVCGSAKYRHQSVRSS